MVHNAVNDMMGTAQNIETDALYVNVDISERVTRETPAVGNKHIFFYKSLLFSSLLKLFKRDTTQHFTSLASWTGFNYNQVTMNMRFLIRSEAIKYKRLVFSWLILPLPYTLFYSITV